MKTTLLALLSLVSFSAVAETASLKDMSLYFCESFVYQVKDSKYKKVVVATSAKEAVAQISSDYDFDRAGNLLKIDGNNYEVITDVRCDGGTPYTK